MGQGNRPPKQRLSNQDNPALTTFGRSSGLSSSMPALNTLSGMKMPVFSGFGIGGNVPFMGSKSRRLAGLRGDGESSTGKVRPKQR